MEDMLYTVEETAKILKCNCDMVYRLCKSGALPFLKLGRYKIRKATLEHFLETYEGYDVSEPKNIKKIEAFGGKSLRGFAAAAKARKAEASTQ